MQPSTRGWKLQHVLHWFGEVPDASSCKRTTLYADSSFPKQTSSLALSGQFIDGCGKHNLFIFRFIVRTKGTLELDRNLGSWCCLRAQCFFQAFSRTKKHLWSNWAPDGRTNFGQVGKRRSSMPCIELGKWSKLLGTGICKRSATV